MQHAENSLIEQYGHVPKRGPLAGERLRTLMPEHLRRLAFSTSALLHMVVPKAPPSILRTP